MEDFKFPSISPNQAFEPTAPCYKTNYEWHSDILNGDRQLRCNLLNNPTLPPTSILESMWDAHTRPAASNRVPDLPIDVHPSTAANGRFQTLLDPDAKPVNIVPMEVWKKDGTVRYPPSLLDCHLALGKHDSIYAPYHHGNGRISDVGEEHGPFRYVTVAWCNANISDAPVIRRRASIFLVHHSKLRGVTSTKHLKALVATVRDYRPQIARSPSYHSVVAVHLLQQATLVWWKEWLQSVDLPEEYAYSMSARRNLLTDSLGEPGNIDNILLRRIE
jgi:hypothetical protein